jgi:hypothetical protein
MKRKLLYGFIALLFVGGSGANAYFLQAEYRKYQSTVKAPTVVSSTATSKVASAKRVRL